MEREWRRSITSSDLSVNIIIFHSQSVPAGAAKKIRCSGRSQNRFPHCRVKVWKLEAAINQPRTFLSTPNQALNDLCDKQGWGIAVTGGRIDTIKVNVPWNSLMNKDSFVEVDGLFVSMRPLARDTGDDDDDDCASMIESMWSSVCSSMQLAQDCMEREDIGPTQVEPAANAMEGLERFAQIIDSSEYLGLC